jgi:hypothetical protein
MAKQVYGKKQKTEHFESGVDDKFTPKGYC